MRRGASSVMLTLQRRRSATMMRSAALAVAYAQVHDAHRASDAVQDAFLKAWQELPRLEDMQRFGGWLMQIVRNAAIDLRRRVKPTVPEYPDLAGKGVDPARASEANDTARRGYRQPWRRWMRRRGRSWRCGITTACRRKKLRRHWKYLPPRWTCD